MSFNKLNVDELKAVAEFFAVDVTVANEEHGPTKKELLAALAEGDDPVSWDDYKDIYQTAQKDAKPQGPDLTATDVKKEEPVKKDTSNYVLVKFERRNPRYDILGYTFTKDHPFHSVEPEVAEYLIRNVEGFRLAMPSEVADYYN